MNTKNLDTFITTSKFGSINAAANALFISPPALQQQINRLETEIGFRLFERKASGIHLTPAGTEAVAEQTVAILRAVLTGEAGA